MKFSHCGRLLATAGQDNIVRIWVLKTAFDYFNNMRLKYNTEGGIIRNSDFLVVWSLEMHQSRSFFIFWLLQVEFHLLLLRKVYVPLNPTLILGWVGQYLLICVSSPFLKRKYLLLILIGVGFYILLLLPRFITSLLFSGKLYSRGSRHRR